MASEEAGFGTIKCPGCGEAIPISEAIHHQIAERTRQEFKAEALEAKRLLAARERELDEKAATFDQTISDRLDAERANLSKKIEAQLRSALSTEIADLKRQADERSERLARAQAVELELRTEKRNLEEREKARELEMARKLDEERVRLQLEISTRLEEEHARQVAEKDKRLSDAMKANDELRRKLQQGSQQLQGEVLELALEDLISQTFPLDLVQPVPKGINGADIIQRVQNPNGDLAGSIIWESKRTKAWSDGWIQKIKEDQRQAKADIAIMVSDALPKDCNQFKQINGIWVTHPRCAIHLASALRLLLLEVASAKRAAVGKNEKMEILYAYLSGIEFRQRVDAIVEAFVSMQEDLQEERRSTERRWAKREKTIQRVITNTSGMYGDLQGLVGSSLATIANLQRVLRATPSLIANVQFSSAQDQSVPVRGMRSPAVAAKELGKAISAISAHLLLRTDGIILSFQAVKAPRGAPPLAYDAGCACASYIGSSHRKLTRCTARICRCA